MKATTPTTDFRDTKKELLMKLKARIEQRYEEIRKEKTSCEETIKKIKYMNFNDTEILE